MLAVDMMHLNVSINKLPSIYWRQSLRIFLVCVEQKEYGDFGFRGILCGMRPFEPE